jgi:hypothetical protein
MGKMITCKIFDVEILHKEVTQRPKSTWEDNIQVDFENLASRDVVQNVLVEDRGFLMNK